MRLGMMSTQGGITAKLSGPALAPGAESQRKRRPAMGLLERSVMWPYMV